MIAFSYSRTSHEILVERQFLVDAIERTKESEKDRETINDILKKYFSDPKFCKDGIPPDDVFVRFRCAPPLIMGFSVPPSAPCIGVDVVITRIWYRTGNVKGTRSQVFNVEAWISETGVKIEMDNIFECCESCGSTVGKTLAELQ